MKKKPASIQFLKPRLMVPKIRNYSQNSFFRTTLFHQIMSI